MPEKDQANTLEVHSSEAGQKLLQFLLRRLSLPQTLLHRWLRTGQIRLNGGRAKPFAHVQDKDLVRLPPFALGMAASPCTTIAATSATAPASPFSKGTTVPSCPDLPPLAHEDTHILVFNKPAGLPVHTGTGHEDSLATRIARHYAEAPFRPTPVHRLDKDTSGLLLTARSYAALRALQDALKDGSLGKEYLAWVQGLWPHQGSRTLRHYLLKRYTGSDEKMHALPWNAESPQPVPSSAGREAKEAVCVVTCLRQQGGCSLMHIRLLTGRTHQIRVQLSAEGHPLLGDPKYGGPAGSLRLHALRLMLPDTEHLQQLNLAGLTLCALPPWQDWQSVHAAPPVLTAPQG